VETKGVLTPPQPGNLLQSKVASSATGGSTALNAYNERQLLPLLYPAFSGEPVVIFDLFSSILLRNPSLGGTGMEETHSKAQIIKENIEATIDNAIEAEKIIHATDNPKQKRELTAKNERRAQAVPSMIREFKEEEAREELGME